MKIGSRISHTRQDVLLATICASAERIREAMGPPPEEQLHKLAQQLDELLGRSTALIHQKRGRKPLTETRPEIAAALKAIAKRNAGGGPLPFLTQSDRAVAKMLSEEGYHVGCRTIPSTFRNIKGCRTPPTAVLKGRHLHRNQIASQFRFLNQRITEFQKDNGLILYVSALFPAPYTCQAARSKNLLPVRLCLRVAPWWPKAPEEWHRNAPKMLILTDAVGPFGIDNKNLRPAIQAIADITDRPVSLAFIPGGTCFPETKILHNMEEKFKAGKWESTAQLIIEELTGSSSVNRSEVEPIKPSRGLHYEFFPRPNNPPPPNGPNSSRPPKSGSDSKPASVHCGEAGTSSGPTPPTGRRTKETHNIATETD